MGDDEEVVPRAKSDDASVARSATDASNANVLCFSFSDVKIVEPKVVSVDFVDAHSNMLVNLKDLTNGGDPVGVRQWQFGKPARPLTLTKGTRVKVKIELEIFPTNADPEECEIIGVGELKRLDPGQGPVKIEFRLKKTLKGGKDTHSLESVDPLPDRVDKLTGDIKWSVKTKRYGTFKAGDSFGHAIYTIFAKPRALPGLEDGITQRRMDEAVKLVVETQETAVERIIESMMTNKLSAFTLNPSSDPALRALDHPRYSNRVGGAWHIVEHLRDGAECQAIVRLVRGIAANLGMPGTYDVAFVFGDANTGDVKEEGMTDAEMQASTTTKIFKGLDSLEVQLGGKKVHPFLIPENPPPIGSVFTIGGPGAPSLNHFEACLKFSNGGAPRYFPGATSRGAQDTKEQVITVFKALIYVSDAGATPQGAAKARMEKVVRTYR